MPKTRGPLYELGRLLRRIIPAKKKRQAPPIFIKQVSAKRISAPLPSLRGSNSATSTTTHTAISPNSSSLQRLLTSLKSGAPAVLLHGRAGTGKTSLIHSLKEQGLRHVVVAPTGVAALNAGGQTIHKFFGIPPRIVNLDDIRPRSRLGSILRNIDLIVIDEISMVRSDLLDVIDRTLRVHLAPDQPFGGMRILLVGDFLQLPPIVEEHDAAILEHRGYKVAQAFGAKSIRDLRNLKMIELSTVYRQSDPEFLELLHNVRTGESLDDTVRRLNLRCLREHRISANPVILTARTEAASQYNLKGLADLPGDVTRFVGAIEKDFRILRDKLPAPEYLDLKKGARIMMVKNDPEKRWVNGSLGTVSNLSATAIWIRLDGSAKEEQVHKAKWESIEYRYDVLTQRVNPVVVGTYTQFPVAHAWAMTIHKAQGLTLNDVRIDLGHGAFSTGQAYVALSRARTLEGLSFAQPLRVSDVMADMKLIEGVRRIAIHG